MRPLNPGATLLAAALAVTAFCLPGQASAAVSGGPRPVHATPLRFTGANPGCSLSWAPERGSTDINVHLVTRRGARMVRVNAQLGCARQVGSLYLQVTLWKTGAIFPHEQARTTVTRARGRYLANTGTARTCRNGDATTFYATAYASIRYDGQTYSASSQTPRKVTLACGT